MPSVRLSTRAASPVKAAARRTSGLVAVFDDAAGIRRVGIIGSRLGPEGDEILLFDRKARPASGSWPCMSDTARRGCDQAEAWRRAWRRKTCATACCRNRPTASRRRPSPVRRACRNRGSAPSWPSEPDRCLWPGKRASLAVRRRRSAGSMCRRTGKRWPPGLQGNRIGSDRRHNGEQRLDPWRRFAMLRRAGRRDRAAYRWHRPTCPSMRRSPTMSHKKRPQPPADETRSFHDVVQLLQVVVRRFVTALPGRNRAAISTL